MGGSWSNIQNPVTGVLICPTDPTKVLLSLNQRFPRTCHLLSFGCSEAVGTGSWQTDLLLVVQEGEHWRLLLSFLLSDRPYTLLMPEAPQPGTWRCLTSGRTGPCQKGPGVLWNCHEALRQWKWLSFLISIILEDDCFCNACFQVSPLTL